MFKYICLFYISLNIIKVNCNCNQDVAKGPIVAALLDLHSDEQCTVVNIKGLQQLAALESTIKHINSEFKNQGIEVMLQVFDTCSSTKVTMTATLKALVAAKQTCLHTPLFLGFIGPENDSSLNIVKNLTKIFNIPHVVPYSLQSHELFPDDKVLHLTTYPVQKHTQAALSLIGKLGWKKISLIFEESTVSRLLAEDLTAAVTENQTLCLSGSILQFQSEQNLKLALGKIKESDGIFIVLETIEWTQALFKCLEDIGSPVVLSVRNVGLHSWAFPNKSQPLFVLQQVSISPIAGLQRLYDAFLIKMNNDQQSVEFKKICKLHGSTACDESAMRNTLETNQDWTVNLMQYGLMLYGSCLRIAHHIKCRAQSEKGGMCPELTNISPKEWYELLTKAAVFIKTSDASTVNKKVTFDMDVPPMYNIYTTYMLENVEKVAWMTDDSFFKMPGYEFPFFETNERRTKCGAVVKIPEPVRTTESPKEVIRRIEKNLEEDADSESFLYLDYGYYETIAIITGIACGILLVMVTMICIVYRSVRVKSGSRKSRRSYSENSSRSPRGSIDS